MKVSANSLEAQPVFSDVYTILASYLAQPDKVRLFISRKRLNLDAFVFTIEQLLGRLIIIRILEDTEVLPNLVLKDLLEKHSQASPKQEDIWDDLLDLFLDFRQSELTAEHKGEVWSLSGVDELHVDNNTARSLINNLYQLDFSNGFTITGILEGWITDMSKSFRQGLEGTFNKK